MKAVSAKQLRPQGEATDARILSASRLKWVLINPDRDP